MSEDFYTGSSHMPDQLSLREPDLLFPLSTDRSRHEHDENCNICSGKFNVPGLSHTKKQFCHFCYRGTCSRCLGYEYFHSESKKIEPMCPECHAKLIAMSANLQEELNKCRLERTELRKMILLAQQEKSLYEKERQIHLEELNIAKKMVQDELNEKGSNLDKLKNHHDELLHRYKTCETRLSDLNFHAGTLNDHANATKHHLDEIKHEKKQKKEKRQEVERELHEIQLKISTFNRVQNEEQVTEEIQRIKSDISDLKLRKREIKNRLQLEEGRLNHIKDQIAKNDKRIEEVHDKLETMKKNEQDSLSDDEQNRIDDLKKQIKQLDELVSLNQKKLASAKEKKKQDTAHYDAHKTSDDLQSKGTRSSTNHAGGDQAGCCAKCILF